MLNLEAALAALDVRPVDKGSYIIRADVLRQVIVALCSEPEPQDDKEHKRGRKCNECRHERTLSYRAPCATCWQDMGHPHWEPKEPPKPEHTCATCQYDALRGSEQPCSDCLEDDSYPGWTPIKPAQEYRLEAGCKVKHWNRNIEREVICVLKRVVVVMGDGDGIAILYPQDVRVVSPATPEVRDWVLTKGACGDSFGIIERINLSDKKIPYYVRTAPLDVLWWARNDLTILAKARHQEQGT